MRQAGRAIAGLEQHSSLAGALDAGDHFARFLEGPRLRDLGGLAQDGLRHSILPFADFGAKRPREPRTVERRETKSTGHDDGQGSEIRANNARRPAYAAGGDDISV